MGLNELGIFWCLLWGLLAIKVFVSREIFDTVGGFDESISLGESTILHGSAKKKVFQ